VSEKRGYCDGCGRWGTNEAVWSAPVKMDFKWLCPACRKDPKVMSERGLPPEK
jgi:hypothetical protein